MGRQLLVVLLSCSILLSAAPGWASSLEQRQEDWPKWSLPAPLQRPGNRDDLVYPAWFEGLWHVDSVDLDAPDDPPLQHRALFQRDARGRLVGDRAFNAQAIGQAVLGDQLLRVEDDPESANRQMAQLKGNLRLETSVTGRRQETPDSESFIADELVLQILHASCPPRLSRIETLSHYRRCGDAICATQLQGRYESPGASLKETVKGVHRYQLRFTPLPTSVPSA